MPDQNETFECLDVIDNLKFPHPVFEKRLLETHISWVILTGDFAYKIKKPVDLGFVDYSSLERRKHFCQRELELNRRFAPQLYLDVVGIRAVDDGFAVCDLGGADEPPGVVEFAVKMRQFPQDAILASRLESVDLTTRLVEDFGRRLADFHSRIEPVDKHEVCAQPEQITHDAEENYQVLGVAALGNVRCLEIQRLQRLSQSLEEQLQPKFKMRLASGRTKRCHGDLHLNNIIQLDGQLIPFDGIEFNDQFQCIDVLSEIAFPVMDFYAQGRCDLGWRLLNAYLEATEEFADLDVLRFYLIHRAMVRAKVAWLNSRNYSIPSGDAADCSAASFAGPWDKYIVAAKYFAFDIQPKLSITHGFSGSGKSTAALKVIDCDGGIRVRSDVLRHQLASHHTAIDKYSLEMNQLVYERLGELARNGLNAGFPMVADASFLNRSFRRQFQKIAMELDLPFEIINCVAPLAELRERINNRRGDASEATIAVLDRQISNHDALGKEELDLIRNE